MEFLVVTALNHNERKLMKVTAGFSIPNAQALLQLDKILMFIGGSDTIVTFAHNNYIYLLTIVS